MLHVFNTISMYKFHVIVQMFSQCLGMLSCRLMFMERIYIQDIVSTHIVEWMLHPICAYVSVIPHISNDAYTVTMYTQYKNEQFGDSEIFNCNEHHSGIGTQDETQQKYSKKYKSANHCHTQKRYRYILQ